MRVEWKSGNLKCREGGGRTGGRAGGERGEEGGGEG